LVRDRVVLSPVARYGGNRSVEFIVAADKQWRTTGGVRRRCGVYSSVILRPFYMLGWCEVPNWGFQSVGGSDGSMQLDSFDCLLS
jgi:hypothetical protein